MIDVVVQINGISDVEHHPGIVEVADFFARAWVGNELTVCGLVHFVGFAEAFGIYVGIARKTFRGKRVGLLQGIFNLRKRVQAYYNGCKQEDNLSHIISRKFLGKDMQIYEL